MRYFIAITLPSLQEQAVLAFRQQWALAGIAPHITVKAPCGLDEAAKTWMPLVRQFCQTTPAPLIQLRHVGVFEPSTLYWRVESPALIVLHQQLLTLLKTSLVDQAACFEGERYTPHLTLGYLPTMPPTQRELMLNAAAALCSVPVSYVATALTIYGKRDQEPYQELLSIPLQVR